MYYELELSHFITDDSDFSNVSSYESLFQNKCAFIFRGERQKYLIILSTFFVIIILFLSMLLFKVELIDQLRIFLTIIIYLIVLII